MAWWGSADLTLGAMAIDQASFEPVYRQLARILREQIQAGELRAGQALPSEASLSQEVSVAFFATLLTGEAVVFALSFSVSSGWPSLREIDRHIVFREWVVTGWVASM